MKNLVFRLLIKDPVKRPNIKQILQLPIIQKAIEEMGQEVKEEHSKYQKLLKRYKKIKHDSIKGQSNKNQFQRRKTLAPRNQQKKKIPPTRKKKKTRYQKRMDYMKNKNDKDNNQDINNNNNLDKNRSLDNNNNKNNSNHYDKRYSVLDNPNSRLKKTRLKKPAVIVRKRTRSKKKKKKTKKKNFYKK